MCKIVQRRLFSHSINKTHLYRGGIHLNEEGQQKLTSAMAEVLNIHSANGQCFPIRTIITRT